MRTRKLIVSVLIGMSSGLGLATLIIAAIEIASRPTEDQLYGCSVAMAAPNGECQ